MALGVQVLDDGLNHHRAPREPGDIRDNGHSRDRRLGVGRRHPVLFGGPAQHLGCERNGRLRHLGRGVGDADVEPARGRDLGDAAAHGAGADDPYHEIGRVEIGRHRHAPLNRGGRFSRNAFMPSFWSSVENRSW